MAEVDFQLQTGRMPKRTAGPKTPPYTAVLPQPVIAALNQYVTALAAHGGPPIPNVNPAAGDLVRGGELFREYCAACHSSTGQGGALVDRPIPAVTEATPTQIGEAVRAGAAQMPAFGTAAVPPTDVDAIAAYIQYLKHPQDKGGNPLSHLGPVAEGLITWFVAMLALLGLIRWIGQRG
jgi:ubiquinol-cytochrome c reductase cytochrome c subunit